MKQITRWKRVYNPIIGMRFFDGGNYSLEYFTIEKLWVCKEYCKHALTPNGSHWFTKYMMQVRTDSGLAYKMPFVPWLDIYTADGKQSISDLYNTNPNMYKKKRW